MHAHHSEFMEDVHVFVVVAATVYGRVLSTSAHPKIGVAWTCVMAFLFGVKRTAVPTSEAPPAVAAAPQRPSGTSRTFSFFGTSSKQTVTPPVSTVPEKGPAPIARPVRAAVALATGRPIAPSEGGVPVLQEPKTMQAAQRMVEGNIAQARKERSAVVARIRDEYKARGIPVPAHLIHKASSLTNQITSWEKYIPTLQQSEATLATARMNKVVAETMKSAVQDARAEGLSGEDLEQLSDDIHEVRGFLEEVEEQTATLLGATPDTPDFDVDALLEEEAMATDRLSHDVEQPWGAIPTGGAPVRRPDIADSVLDSLMPALSLGHAAVTMPLGPTPGGYDDIFFPQVPTAKPVMDPGAPVFVAGRR
jgi:hypothetical protein